MLKMTITWRIYILAVNFATFNAYQPAGYLGCFLDKYGDSMVNPLFLFHDENNTAGEYCKRTARAKSKRYAGTKLWKCFGGDGYNKSRSSTLCTNKCPGNANEICGDGHLMIIYDTWMCITSPCQNGSTCNDINADTFTCNCTEGWTGHFCNAQTSKSLLAVSISVPLAVVIVATGVISVLVIRKRRNLKKYISSAIYNKSEEAAHTFSNTAYNGQDIQPDVPVYASVTAGHKAKQNIDGIGEESETNNTNINNELHLDEDGYGHLTSKTTAVLFDPTYSHMTNLQKNKTHDNTYSHIDKVTVKHRSEVILNDADADDTYSNINRSAGNLKPGVNMNVTDDIYSKLDNNGTKKNQRDRIGKYTEMVQNEPQYDHT